MEFLIIILLCVSLSIIVYIYMISSKSKDIYDTNIFSNLYRSNPKRFEELVVDYLSAPNFKQYTVEDLSTTLDYIYNDSTLYQLELLSGLSRNPSSVFTVMINFKKQHNDLFKKYPSLKPSFYRI